MAHTSKDKAKLLARVRRIGGQVTAIEKALDEDQDCGKVLQQLAACRGALNGLMGEIIEGHIRFHVVDPNQDPASEQAQAAQELIDVLKTYLK